MTGEKIMYISSFFNIQRQGNSKLKTLQCFPYKNRTRKTSLEHHAVISIQLLNNKFQIQFDNGITKLQ